MKYKGHESTILEFKEKMPQNQQIVKSIISFCNMFGGRLIIGINDQGEILGAPELGISRQMIALQQTIYQSCSPPIIPAIYTQRVEDKLLLIVEVSSGMNKPYFITSAGMQEGTYVRIGAQTVKANPALIAELQWQARGNSLDKMPVYTATVEDIDSLAFENFLQNRKKDHKSVSSPEIMEHYDLIIKEHTHRYPTTAAILCFGKTPERFLTEAFIICTHFKGRDGREAIATRDCTGRLFTQLEDCLEFITSRINRSFVIETTRRKEHYEIPIDALREVIINAIVHRNYQIQGPTKVAIYEDRIEVFSPGNFAGPIQVDQLELGVTYIRNPIICRLFREIGYIEKLGSGFITLFKSYKKYKLPTPQVIEGTGFIKCILPRPTAHMKLAIDLENEEQEFLKLFLVAEEITVKDVMQHFQCSRQTGGRMLNKYFKKKLLKKIGKGPATRYRRN